MYKRQPQITNDILGVIWGKFIVNCGINPLCAVTGLRSGEIFQNTAADEMQTKILEEIMAVVKAKGIKAPKKDMITYVKIYQAVDITNPLCCNILKRAA